MKAPAIADLIPHAGPMCLLEEIVAWDEASVHCRSSTHRLPDHPLARGGRLSIVTTIEYAAQATAVHGGLLAAALGLSAAPAAPGRLVAIKHCVWASEGLAEATDCPLEVRCLRRLGGPGGSIYDFSIDAGNRVLASGQLTVKTTTAAQ